MDNLSEELNSLLSSAALIFFGVLFSSLSLLIERVIIARFLSVDLYGEVSIGLSILMMGTTISLIGFKQGVPRYVSRYDSEIDKRGIWLSGILCTGAAALLTILVLLPNVHFVSSLLFEQSESIRLLQLFVFCIPFLVLLEICIGTIRGFENTTYKILVQDILYPILRMGLIIGLLAYGWGFIAPGLAYLIAVFISVVVGHVFLSRLLPLLGPAKTHIQELVVFSAPLLLSTVFAILLTHVDTLLIGYLRSSYEVGLYNAAYPLATGLLLVLSAFGFLYLPLTSRLDSENRLEEIDAIYKTTTKWIYIVTFPVFLIFTMFSGDALSIFFGENYRPAGLALTILSIGFFTNASFGRNRETLSALGHTMQIFVANMAAFILNILLNFVLIPYYGIVGAAIASALSYVIMNIIIYYVLDRLYNISPFSWTNIRTFIGLATILLPVFFILSRAITMSVLTLIPLLLFGAAITLVTTVLVNGIQEEDVVVVETLEETIGVDLSVLKNYLQFSETE